MSVQNERTSPPPVLYKYYSPARIPDVILDGHVRFSRPSDFNDTFDSSYYTEDKDSKKWRSKFRSSLAIFCLTADPDNHLMWVHYAMQHTGFVIGFKTSHHFFTDEGGTLDQVQYGQRSNRAFMIEGEPPLDVCLQKSREWSYEKEWRCIRQASGPQSRDVLIPYDGIAEIILGSKMEKTNYPAILQFVETLNEEPEVNIVISQSKPYLQTRTFHHAPLSLHLCQECGGQGFVARRQDPSAGSAPVPILKDGR